MNDDEKSIADELGAAADLLNEAIERAEDALASLRLGVTASVPLGTENGSRLRFGKTKTGWRLLVENGDGESRLTCTSRETRVAAVERFDDLYDALVLAARSNLDGTERAVVKARAFASEVRDRKVSRRRESIIGA